MIWMRIMMWYWVFSFTLQLGLIMFLMAGAFEKRKYFALRLVACVAVLAVASMYFEPKNWGMPHTDLFVLLNPLLRFIFLFALCIAAIMTCYKIDLKQTCFCGIGAYAMQHICFCFINALRRIMEIFIANFLFNLYFAEIIYYVVLFGFYLVVIRRLRTYNNYVLSNGWVSALLVFMLVTTILLSNLEDILDYRNTSPVQGVKIIFFVYRLFVCSLIVIIQFVLLDKSYLQNENVTLKSIQKLEEKKYELSNECIDMIKIKYHDLRHVINELSAAGTDEVKKGYIASVNAALDGFDLCVNVGNAALNTVVTEKLILCRNRRIKFIYSLDGAILDFLNVTDIYSFFGNLLDNAIESVSELGEDRRIIELEVRRKDAFIVISERNPCEKEVRFVGGLPQTSSGNKSEHGFGTKSMKYLVRKYGGEISFEKKDDVFTVAAYIPLNA